VDVENAGYANVKLANVGFVDMEIAYFPAKVVGCVLVAGGLRRKKRNEDAKNYSIESAGIAGKS
jgi:hypothetical protein